MPAFPDAPVLRMPPTCEGSVMHTGWDDQFRPPAGTMTCSNTFGSVPPPPPPPPALSRPSTLFPCDVCMHRRLQDGRAVAGSRTHLRPETAANYAACREGIAEDGRIGRRSTLR